jgi:hypothetical protein
MLDKVESIPSARELAQIFPDEAAKYSSSGLKDLATAVGRNDTLADSIKSKKPWSLAINKGESPIQALANDSTLEPATREAAKAVVAGYKATGTPLPRYIKSLRTGASTSGYISHVGDGSNMGIAAEVALKKTLATPGTIIHEYVHGLTVRGLVAMENSKNPEHRAVLSALQAISAYIKSHPSVTNTRMGRVYATTNIKELLAEVLSGRVLPLTSNITVEDIIKNSSLNSLQIEGLSLLTDYQPKS